MPDSSLWQNKHIIWKQNIHSLFATRPAISLRLSLQATLQSFHNQTRVDTHRVYKQNECSLLFSKAHIYHGVKCKVCMSGVLWCHFVHYQAPPWATGQWSKSKNWMHNDHNGIIHAIYTIIFMCNSWLTTQYQSNVWTQGVQYTVERCAIYTVEYRRPLKALLQTSVHSAQRHYSLQRLPKDSVASVCLLPLLTSESPVGVFPCHLCALCAAAHLSKYSPGGWRRRVQAEVYSMFKQ